MKIIISNKDDYEKEFVEKYLIAVINYLFDNLYDKKILTKLDKEFNIKSYDIIKFALNNLKVYEQPNSYVIEVSKNKHWNNYNVDALINLITYGNRTCKGYLLIYNIFKYIVENINYLYEEWLTGGH